MLVSERCYLCQMCQCQDGATVSGVSVSGRCYLCQVCQCQDSATCVRCVSIRTVLPVSGVSVSGLCYLCQVCQCQNGVSCKDGCVAVCDDGHYGLECAFVLVSEHCYLSQGGCVAAYEEGHF